MLLKIYTYDLIAYNMITRCANPTIVTSDDGYDYYMNVPWIVDRTVNLPSSSSMNALQLASDLLASPSIFNGDHESSFDPSKAQMWFNRLTFARPSFVDDEEQSSSSLRDVTLNPDSHHTPAIYISPTWFDGLARCGSWLETWPWGSSSASFFASRGTSGSSFCACSIYTNRGPLALLSSYGIENIRVTRQQTGMLYEHLCQSGEEDVTTVHIPVVWRVPKSDYKSWNSWGSISEADDLRNGAWWQGRPYKNSNTATDDKNIIPAARNRTFRKDNNYRAWITRDFSKGSKVGGGDDKNKPNTAFVNCVTGETTNKSDRTLALGAFGPAVSINYATSDSVIEKSQEIMAVGINVAAVTPKISAWGRRIVLLCIGMNDAPYLRYQTASTTTGDEEAEVVKTVASMLNTNKHPESTISLKYKSLMNLPDATGTSSGIVTTTYASYWKNPNLNFEVLDSADDDDADSASTTQSSGTAEFVYAPTACCYLFSQFQYNVGIVYSVTAAYTPSSTRIPIRNSIGLLANGCSSDSSIESGEGSITRQQCFTPSVTTGLYDTIEFADTYDTSSSVTQYGTVSDLPTVVRSSVNSTPYRFATLEGYQYGLLTTTWTVSMSGNDSSINRSLTNWTTGSQQIVCLTAPTPEGV